ncbi:MAG: chemotaxis protein CheW [Planctomycetota bacterium]|jgi:two-component system chemotaxis sensor kinase CheA
MSNAPEQPGDSVHDEMSEYLQVFMDETEEQLDDLTEALLVLETRPESAEHLHEAFRLIHSIKGSAGMMGLDSIAALTHHLESRFERFRSGVEKLDEATMNLVLRCIDFLRDCVRRLRAEQGLAPAAELLQELSERDDRPAREAATPPDDGPADPEGAAVAPAPLAHDGEGYRLVVHFEPGLPLVDLKARLILSRLSNLGDIVAHRPADRELEQVESLDQLEVVLTTERAAETIRAAADVNGVSAIDLAATGDEPALEPQAATATPAAAESTVEAEAEPEPASVAIEAPAAAAAAPEVEEPAVVETAAPASEPRAVARTGETMRVDIERLDDLMNLAGELVVNRARFVQVASEVTPHFGRRNVTSRARDFSESLRRTIDHLETATNGQWTADVAELRAGLELLEEQARAWDSGRRGLAQIGEAIDQLTRISDSLQQGVLDTRMVPVAPLFNRFKRVVRDLAQERGKKVDLVIRGEKTELDKRMIDELGEPLVHLVRNSMDHGLEPPDVRRSRGKPEIGTIVLEASHSGNSVFIHIRDDGGGIDVDRIRAKAVDRGLLDAAAAEGLTEQAAVEYIWHPGFSTAREVTDISGRGVGMDAVRARIAELNGTVDVESVREQGTTFTIRLPLTLAIINSLLIRARDIVFSMPIEDVREIVAVSPADVVTVHGKRTIDVRGEFIPLVGIGEVFDWRDLGDGRAEAPASDGNVHAVILQAGGRTMGLVADELLGSQEIVIKSLAENFIAIRGLSGASILGDGTVCLMLDVGTLIELAIGRARQERVS